MRRVFNTLLFGLFFGLVMAPLADADLWRCVRPDGSELYTDRLRDSASCQKYEPTANLGYVSGRASSSYSPPPVVQRLPPPKEVSSLEDRVRRSPRDAYYPATDDSDYFDHSYYPPSDDSDYFDHAGYDDERSPGFYDDDLGYYPGGGILFSNRRFLRPKSRMHAARPPVSASPTAPPAGRGFPDEKAGSAPVSPPFHRH